jgi:hypothetical protein
MRTDRSLAESGSLSAVKLFDGDSVFTARLLRVQSSRADLSNGIVIASVSDTLTNQTEITVYDSGTGLFEVLHDTARISGLQIDNGLICWSWKADVMDFLKLYYLGSGITEDWGTVQNPVVDDDDRTLWVMPKHDGAGYYRNYLPAMKTVIQSRFKDNDGSRIIWGSLDINKRTSFIPTNFCTINRSIVYKDFITTTTDSQSGATISPTFISMMECDPELIIDSPAMRNVPADDLTTTWFQVRRRNNINQAWLYDIATTDLQLTSDDSDDITNTFTLVDGGYACWFRDSSEVSMLKLYDGISSIRITDSAVNNEFGFREGKIVGANRRFFRSEYTM